ncbi:MAG: hypothetical protein QOG49_565 [Frankiaceae bacterium]|nr:hypothetical protein [Frankiaceae bacterium]
MTPTEAGSRYVAALVAKDADGLVQLFARDVQFRGLTPGRAWESQSPAGVLDVILGNWFEESDLVEAVDHIEHGLVEDRARVDYRLRVRNPDGLFAVEQRAYFDLDEEGLINRMHAICSGFRQVGN